MKTLLITMTAAALLAAPALAQQPTDQRGPPDAAKPADFDSLTPQQQHERCQSIMGQQMKGRTPHSHTSDKLGHAPPPPTPPSQAEMQKMHEKCAAIMAQDKAAKSKP